MHVALTNGTRPFHSFIDSFSFRVWVLLLIANTMPLYFDILFAKLLNIQVCHCRFSYRKNSLAVMGFAVRKSWNRNCYLGGGILFFPPHKVWRDILFYCCWHGHEHEHELMLLLRLTIVKWRLRMQYTFHYSITFNPLSMLGTDPVCVIFIGT